MYITAAIAQSEERLSVIERLLNPGSIPGLAMRHGQPDE